MDNFTADETLRIHAEPVASEFENTVKEEIMAWESTFYQNNDQSMEELIKQYWEEQFKSYGMIYAVR